MKSPGARAGLEVGGSRVCTHRVASPGIVEAEPMTVEAVLVLVGVVLVVIALSTRAVLRLRRRAVPMTPCAQAGRKRSRARPRRCGRWGATRGCAGAAAGSEPAGDLLAHAPSARDVEGARQAGRPAAGWHDRSSGQLAQATPGDRPLLGETAPSSSTPPAGRALPAGRPRPGPPGTGAGASRRRGTSPPPRRFTGKLLTHAPRATYPPSKDDTSDRTHGAGGPMTTSPIGATPGRGTAIPHGQFAAQGVGHHRVHHHHVTVVALRGASPVGEGASCRLRRWMCARSC
ncbi:hypothetical protein CLV37_10222 [Kineococcus rhizosphaerae]|uniref:Uncharacterized protein n=1 Tax=Kineococcus rhizosphaerae TaxID=559628 RepID=A0A2T0R7D0_9ACTN|nr:hypothetical protein CLV37_10222 [Kineococcus rhizosphaerae]